MMIVEEVADDHINTDNIIDKMAVSSQISVDSGLPAEK